MEEVFTHRFRPHPGFEIKLVTPEIMEYLGGDGIVTKDTIGYVAELPLRKMDGGNGGGPVYQKFILLTKEGLKPEILAHEIGHARLRHRHRKPIRFGAYLDEEIEAWVWAERQRGKPLKTPFIYKVAVESLFAFDETPQAVVARLKYSLRKVGMELSQGEDTRLVECLADYVVSSPKQGVLDGGIGRRSKAKGNLLGGCNE